LLSKLESSLNTDLERGFTAHGPHREDFLFFLDGQPVNHTASRGETRSLLLALKIFELGLIEAAREQKPIFLLDDVFSELDGARRRALVKRLKKHQTIITTTDAESVLEYFSETHNLIPLS
jgi:DNA replication and repair protein RecF